MIHPSNVQWMYFCKYMFKSICVFMESSKNNKSYSIALSFKGFCLKFKISRTAESIKGSVTQIPGWSFNGFRRFSESFLLPLRIKGLQTLGTQLLVKTSIHFFYLFFFVFCFNQKIQRSFATTIKHDGIGKIKIFKCANFNCSYFQKKFRSAFEQMLTI